jgi:D-alanyl-D-alanine carboxypeptidase
MIATMLNHPLPRRTFLSGAALMLCAPNLAFAQSAPDALGQALARLFDPVEGPSARRNFAATYVSEAARERWADASFQDALDEMSAASGGLDFIAARVEPRALRISVRARRQGVVRNLLVHMDRNDESKVFSLATIPMPAAYDRPGPSGPVSFAALARAIDDRLRFSVERDEFSGVARIVSPQGDVVYESAFGFADRERGIVNTPDTRFHLGSADKSFTALMVARLIGEGRFSYETRLAELLPDYPNAEFARACTVRHLLTHSAGLGPLFGRPGWDNQRRFTRMAEIFPAFAAEPPAFAPGARASYSNEGFIVLGAIIEAVTGRSWYDLLSEQIYAPAGMTRSAHFTMLETGDDIALGYRYLEGDHLGLNGRHANTSHGWRGASCGGGYSTVRDMTSYLRALRAGRLLPQAIVEPMIVQAEPGLRAYGMGFIVNAYNGRRVIGHSGGGPHSGVDGDNGIVWETGWAFSILGNYDAPAAGTISRDIKSWLAAM